VNERRRADASILTSPVLIGALTVLVVIVAVVLAYNANNGLPFVPTYDLHVRAVNAEELQRGGDVNEGGALVGIVGSVTPARDRAGRPIAMLNLKLYKNIEPLPRDTTFTIRLKGAIGLKYLAVNRGHDAAGFADNATVPVSQAGSSVDFDQVLDMFSPATRTGVQHTTVGFGSALAGRGESLNATIGALRPLLAALQPVAANLASPRTHLAGFFRGLESFSSALAPVAGVQAQLFTNLNTTFGAIAPVAPAFAATISDTPPAFEETINESPRIRSFLLDTGSLLHQLRPGFATLRTSAPVLADAFATGAKTLPPTASLDTQLVALSKRLSTYSANGSVQGGLDRLSLTAASLKRPLAFLAPVQSVCNYPTLFLANTANLLSEHVTDGTFLRFVQVAITDLPGRESEPSHKLYDGPVDQASGPVHSDPYPNTASPGEVDECSAGNEPFVKHAVVGNPSVNVGHKTEVTTRSTK
jgi:ABC-type transporter Mla subunit MlaD